MKTFLFLSSLIFFASAANAQINFNSLSHSGTGCPPRTLSTVTTPDGASISILFDEFRVEVPQYDGNNDNHELPQGPRPRNRNTPTVNHKNCSLSFTATLPPGTKVDSLDINLQSRGATIIDKGLEGYYSTLLLGYKGLASSNGNPVIVARKIFGTRLGPVDENWIEDTKKSVALHSGCSGGQGRDIRFDLRTVIGVQSVEGDITKHGIIMLDSNDIKGSLKFTLRTKPCGRVR